MQITYSDVFKNLFTTAIAEFCEERAELLATAHIAKTPDRVYKAWMDMTSGIEQKADDILATRFPIHASGVQMIHRTSIRVKSLCAHHLIPFIGIAHFAYIPENEIVGISKIPRLVNMFARRLQVQENLTNEIVDAFYSIVKPAGCGLHMKCYHFCEIMRGAEEHASPTATTALRGTFLTEHNVRNEFMSSINHSEVIFP